MPSSERAVKRQRTSYACDFCHRRGLKCRNASVGEQRVGGGVGSCLTCLEHGQTCTRTREAKRRGTKPRSSKPSADMRDEAQDRVDSATVSETKKLLGPQSLSQTDRPRGAEALHRDLVALLLEVYLNSVHPVFPLYCERELWIRWKDGSFPSTQPEWTSLTTMCALSMHHVRKGALFKDAVMPDHSDDLAEKLVYDAVESTPVDFYQQHDLEIVRAYGFLALLGIQSKNYSLTHRYLALWHGICGVRSLHDESKWPAQLNGCDREMRKRLFWVFYRLEVHMACVTGQIIRTPEAQCNVGYPEGSHHPAFVSGRDGLF